LTPPRNWTLLAILNADSELNLSSEVNFHKIDGYGDSPPAFPRTVRERLAPLKISIGQFDIEL
jgi:hypothetical protein